MTREEYRLARKQEKKDKIKRIFECFLKFDGDFKTIADEVGVHKSRVSTLLSDEVIMEMIREKELLLEDYEKIKNKIVENQIRGRKKGGDSFKEKHEVVFNDSHRITGHKIK